MAKPNGRRLGSVAAELVSLQESQEDTTVAVNGVASLIREQLDLTKQGKLDALEAAAEARRGGIGSRSGSGKKGGKGGGGLLDFLKNPLAGMTGMLSALAMPALIAITASLTDFDQVLKALRVPYYIDVLKGVFNAFTTSIKSITRAINAVIDAAKAIPDNIPKVRIVMPENWKVRLPEIPRPNFFYKGIEYAADKLEDFKKLFRINLPEIPKPAFMVAGVAYAADKIDDLKKTWANIKLPDLAGTFDKFPRLEIEIPQGLKDTFQTIKNTFGKVASGAKGAAGSGLFGFISSLGDFASKLLAPIRAIGKVALGPITMAIVGIIDFFVGFWKGWQTEAQDESATLGDKLLAGLEGGLLGFIKGITEGFDLLFVKIPAWLLEKFGLVDAANILRGFSITKLVDPIWFGIKNIVMFVADNFILMKDIIAASFSFELTRISNGFKNAFTRLGTFVQNLGDELYIMLSNALQFNFPGIVGKVPDFLPSWMGGGKEIEIMPAFSLGMGDATTRAQAQSRIDSRNAERDSKIASRNNETAERLKELNDLQAELRDNMQAQIANYNSQVNSGNDNSSTVTNNFGGGGSPSSNDGALLEGVQ